MHFWQWNKENNTLLLSLEMCLWTLSNTCHTVDAFKKMHIFLQCGYNHNRWHRKRFFISWLLCPGINMHGPTRSFLPVTSGLISQLCRVESYGKLVCPEHMWKLGRKPEASERVNNNYKAIHWRGPHSITVFPCTRCKHLWLSSFYKHLSSAYYLEGTVLDRRLGWRREACWQVH